MIDTASRDILQQCVRRESRSLLQYAREVPLWVSPADRPVLAKLRALAEAELAAIDALGVYLQKQHAGLTTLGPFPSQFTTVNDAALHYLLPILIREQQAGIAAIEADYDHMPDADARAHLAEILRLKRQHLPEMEALSSQPHTIWK